MKAILFFAFLALVASTDYHLFRLGFNDQFSFDAKQRALNRKCFDTLAASEKTLRETLKGLIEDRHTIIDFLTTGAKIFTDLKGVASNECLSAVTAIAKIGRTRDVEDSKILFRHI